MVEDNLYNLDTRRKFALTDLDRLNHTRRLELARLHETILNSGNEKDIIDKQNKSTTKITSK